MEMPDGSGAPLTYVLNSGNTSNFENVWAGEGNDHLTGLSDNNILAGAAGDDIIYGAAGDDITYGVWLW